MPHPMQTHGKQSLKENHSNDEYLPFHKNTKTNGVGETVDTRQSQF